MSNYNKLVNKNYIEYLLNRRTTKEFLYFILDIDNNLIKIGRSNNPSKRLNTLKTANPFKLHLIHLISNTLVDIDIITIEKTLHKLFDKYNKNREWFKFEGSLQHFVLFLISLNLDYCVNPYLNFIGFSNTVNSYMSNCIHDIDNHAFIDAINFYCSITRDTYKDILLQYSNGIKKINKYRQELALAKEEHNKLLNENIRLANKIKELEAKVPKEVIVEPKCKVDTPF